MARRSDHTREELREMAIAAGTELIEAEGVAGFGARKVAKEIGYTVGTLYYIFKDSSELLLHINGATLDHMRSHMTENLSGRKPENRIKRLASLYAEYAANNLNRWNAIFEFSLPGGEPLPDWYLEKVAGIFSMAEETLLPLFNGDRKKAARAAKLIWAGVHGICQLGLTGKLANVGAEPMEALTDSLIENYLKGATGR